MPYTTVLHIFWKGSEMIKIASYWIPQILQEFKKAYHITQIQREGNAFIWLSIKLYETSAKAY